MEWRGYLGVVESGHRSILASRFLAGSFSELELPNLASNLRDIAGIRADALLLERFNNLIVLRVRMIGEVFANRLSLADGSWVSRFRCCLFSHPVVPVSACRPHPGLPRPPGRGPLFPMRFGRLFAFYASVSVSLPFRFLPEIKPDRVAVRGSLAEVIEVAVSVCD